MMQNKTHKRPHYGSHASLISLFLFCLRECVVGIITANPMIHSALQGKPMYFSFESKRHLQEDCMKTADQEHHIKQIEDVSQLHDVMHTNTHSVLSLWETLRLPYLALMGFREG